MYCEHTHEQDIWQTRQGLSYCMEKYTHPQWVCLDATSGIVTITTYAQWM